jgi:hypothetical protein
MDSPSQLHFHLLVLKVVLHQRCWYLHVHVRAHSICLMFDRSHAPGHTLVPRNWRSAETDNVRLGASVLFRADQQLQRTRPRVQPTMFTVLFCKSATLATFQRSRSIFLCIHAFLFLNYPLYLQRNCMHTCTRYRHRYIDRDAHGIYIAIAIGRMHMYAHARDLLNLNSNSNAIAYASACMHIDFDYAP